MRWLISIGLSLGTNAVALLIAAAVLVGVIGLVTTFLILLVTDVTSDGIQIEGTTTWLAATVIVWLGTVVFELLDGPLRRRFVRAT